MALGPRDWWSLDEEDILKLEGMMLQIRDITSMCARLNPATPEKLTVERSQDRPTSLDDVGGLEDVKSSLREIAISFKNPEAMEKWGVSRPTGLLLYGEPGTGKTMLAEAMTGEIGADLISISGSDIYGKYLGESEDNIKLLFDEIEKVNEPTIILLDEFDSIISDDEHQARKEVAGEFKRRMSALSEANSNVLIVATTNSLDNIDPALIRSGRFSHKIYIPMPDHNSRRSIFANCLFDDILPSSDYLDQSLADMTSEQDGSIKPQFRRYSEDIDLDRLAEMTYDMSGADITEILRRLRFSRATQEALAGTPAQPISQLEIESAIDRFRRG